MKFLLLSVPINIQTSCCLNNFYYITLENLISSVARDCFNNIWYSFGIVQNILEVSIVEGLLDVVDKYYIYCW